MSTTTLNLMISKDYEHSRNLSASMSSWLRLNIGKNRMFVIRSEKIDADLYSTVMEKVDEFSKVNVMLTEGFHKSAISLLKTASERR